MRISTRKSLIFLLLLCVVVTGCGQTSEVETSKSSIGKIEGTITISGAWALYPLVVRWGEEFQKVYPDVRFDISAGGAGKGMADALGDIVDLGMVSREVHPAEIEKGAFWVSVTKDAVFVTISEKNPVWAELHEQGLSQETLTGIFITGDITTWGQAVGKPEIEDPIHVYTRSDACGAASTFAAFLDMQQEDLQGVGVYGDPGLLDAVIKDPLAIGFNNLNYAFDFDTALPVTGAGVVPLDVNDNGSVESEEDISTKEKAIRAVSIGEYPSPPARDLNLVTQGKPDGLVKAFVRWVLTDGQQFVGEAGYIDLPENRLAEELGKLD